MADKIKRLLNENAFLPDPKKRKNLDTSKPIDIKLRDDKEKKPIYHTLPKEGVFKQYEDLDIIAAQIAKELLSEQIYEAVEISKTDYKKIIEGGLTFFMSSEHSQKRSGLLSICPAVLTAMKIWKAMPESSLKTKLFASIETGINAIFKIIYRDGEQVLNDDIPVFDASPYETDAFIKGLKGRSYIDSISWTVPVFLRILNLTEEKDKKEIFVFQDNNLRNKAEFLAKWCLKYINGCLLLGDDGKTPIGWSFTRLEEYKGAERSLYFTYAASTIYLSFYAEYEEIILSQRTIDEISVAHDDEGADSIHFNLNEKYWENKNNELGKALETVSAMLDNKQKQAKQEELDEQKIEELEMSIAKLDEIKKALDCLLKPENAERIRALAEFNDDNRITNEVKGENDSLEKVGEIARLKWNLEQISAGIWTKAGDKLEDNFLYEDFNATVAENDAIENGGQTNALFTGLLQIGIIINCAYDAKIYREKGEREYVKMQDTMLLHVQKTQRFFDKLGEGDVDKSFAVDSFILRFMEKVNDGGGQGTGLNDRALVEILRKHHIRVCSLTPMLLKTNNLLSEYVIQYPQKQMGESLLRISQKRYYDKSNKGKERFRWLWETDNYHAISNYYYVGAIFDFYTYYKKYEQLYVKRYEHMRTDLLRDLNFSDQVRKHYQDIADEVTKLKKEHAVELKEKEDEIAEALARVKKSEIGDKLVSDVNQIIEDSAYFDDPRFFKRIIDGMRKQLAEELAARYAQNPSEEQAVLEKLARPAEPKDYSFFSLLQAFAADIILPSAIEAKKGEGTGLITDLGKSGLEGVMPADFALKGGKQLINDGLIDKLFAFVCSPLIWKDQKKQTEER